MKEYIRQNLFDKLYKGLKGEPRLLQVIIGPRQVGKTTLALQVHNKWSGPKFYFSADLPNIPTIDWVVRNWEGCRALYRKNKRETLLILDEIQKSPVGVKRSRNCLMKMELQKGEYASFCWVHHRCWFRKVWPRVLPAGLRFIAIIIGHTKNAISISDSN